MSTARSARQNKRPETETQQLEPSTDRHHIGVPSMRR
jgi:hypothetical protein